MHMSMYKSYLSIVTRPSGYAIAIVIPKDAGYAVLGSSQLDGPYDPLHLLGYIVGLWDAAVNQPRTRQGLAPVGPHCLLCNYETDIAAINQMLKQTGGIPATASQPYTVATGQTPLALQTLQDQLSIGQLQAAASLTEQLRIGLAMLGDLNRCQAFTSVSLQLAAIVQVIAYAQTAPLSSAEITHPSRPVLSVPTVPVIAQSATPVPLSWVHRLTRLFTTG